MCGIAGFRDLHLKDEEFIPILARMTGRLIHRGPDSQGFFTGSGVGMGVRRLSIIDVEGGHQPVTSEDKAIIALMNGEIYNAPELREELKGSGHIFRTNTDTEVIPHLYEEYGIEGAPKRMIGMFAIALFDLRQGSLHLVRDRVGIKPLHYAVKGDSFVFASEIKSILCHPCFRTPPLDRGALLRYLLFEYIPCPLTIFEGIRKVPPGHILTLRGGEVKLTAYWDLTFTGERNKGREQFLMAREELEALLSDSVRLRLRSDVPLGTLLSGGIDSSIVTSLGRGLKGEGFKTFSTGFEERRYDESTYFNRVARFLGTDHLMRVLGEEEAVSLIPRVIPLMDEPFADSSLIPTFFLSSLVRGEGVKVVLSGDGGDELFSGYPTYMAHTLLPPFALPSPLTRWLSGVANRLIPTSLNDVSPDYMVKRMLQGLDFPAPQRNNIWLGAFLPSELGPLLSPDFFEGLAPEEMDPFTEVRSHMERVRGCRLLERMEYLDLKMYLQDCILNKVDRASMMNSIEVRVPILDHRVVEFSGRIPPGFKLRRGVAKYILKETFRDRLPPGIPERKKKGFGLPTALYMRGRLKGLLLELLQGQGVRREGLFNERYISKLIEEHMGGRVNHRRRLWTLLVFRLWSEERGRKG